MTLKIAAGAWVAETTVRYHLASQPGWNRPSETNTMKPLLSLPGSRPRRGRTLKMSSPCTGRKAGSPPPKVPQPGNGHWVSGFTAAGRKPQRAPSPLSIPRQLRQTEVRGNAAAFGGSFIEALQVFQFPWRRDTVWDSPPRPFERHLVTDNMEQSRRGLGPQHRQVGG